MGMTLFLHIVGGTLGLLSGYVALYSSKGQPLHRRSGRVFVYAMTVMTLFGAWVALAMNNRWTPMNFSAGMVTFYLVLTATTTVKPLARGGRAMHIAALVLATAFALADLGFGLQAIANGGKRNGVPAFPYLMFGAAALFGAIGDVRVLRSGPLQGSRRIARHLWRMTFALFIAALSFFIGQAKVIPKPVRIFPLLAVPVLLVLLTMAYWLWRVRVRRTFRGIAGADAPEIASMTRGAHVLL